MSHFNYPKTIPVSTRKIKRILRRLWINKKTPHKPVFVVFSKEEVQLLTSLQLFAITLNGNLSLTDFSSLKKRLIFIFVHNDEASFEMGRKLQKILLKYTSFVFIVSTEPLGVAEGGTCIDWVHAWLKERNIGWRDLKETQHKAALRKEIGQLAVLNADNRPMRIKSAFELYREYDYGARPLPCAQEDTPELVEAKISAKAMLRQELDDIATMMRLSSLSDVEYLKARHAEAQRLDVPVTALEEMVQHLRPQQQSDTTSITLKVLPWYRSINGAELMAELVDTVHRHIICDDYTAIAAAGWILHTWFIDVVNVSPIAFITAATRRCGKSRLLDLFALLTRRPLALSNISTAAFVRVLNGDPFTMLMDEVENWLRSNEELRGVLNAGITRTAAFFVRAGKAPDELVRLSTWGAKALAGIGDLHETLMDRAICMVLRRMLATEECLELRDVDPRVFKILASKIARWAIDSRDAIKTARPTLPASLNSRQKDCWGPLLAIADCAQGDWPIKMREAAVALCERDERRVIGGSEELMEGIQAAFDDARKDRISTRELLGILCEDEYAPWLTYDKGRPMTPRQLAVMLNAYGIAPQTIRTQVGTIKGYYRRQFDDVFGRYVGPSAKP